MVSRELAWVNVHALDFQQRAVRFKYFFCPHALFLAKVLGLKVILIHGNTLTHTHSLVVLYYTAHQFWVQFVHYSHVHMKANLTRGVNDYFLVK